MKRRKLCKGQRVPTWQAFCSWHWSLDAKCQDEGFTSGTPGHGCAHATRRLRKVGSFGGGYNDVRSGRQVWAGSKEHCRVWKHIHRTWGRASGAQDPSAQSPPILVFKTKFLERISHSTDCPHNGESRKTLLDNQLPPPLFGALPMTRASVKWFVVQSGNLAFAVLQAKFLSYHPQTDTKEQTAHASQPAMRCVRCQRELQPGTMEKRRPHVFRSENRVTITW